MSVDDIVNELNNENFAGDAVDSSWLIYLMKKVSAIGSLVLGYLIVIIIILVPFVILTEISYIQIPPLRRIMDLGMEQEGKKRSKVLNVICRDAKKAIENSYINNRNSVTEYLFIKLKSIVFISFVVALVLQGTSMFFGIAGGLAGNAIRVFEQTLYK